MRILYFSQDYTPHDFRFLQTASEGGHELYFLRLEDRGRHSEARPLPEGVEVISWEGGRQPFRWVNWPGRMLDLRRVLRQVQPDLVHAGPVQGPAFMVALTKFRPLITMSWGSDLLLGARKGFGRWAARFTLSRTDVFICDADAVLDVAADLGLPRAQTVKFPWGVDLERFSPGDGSRLRKELGWQDAFILLSTRSWERLYGVDTLVKGFLQVASRDPRLNLLMLGNGSRKPKIMRMVAESGLADRVEFVGQVPNKDLPQYFRAADLYLSASRSDGSSVSLMEALACGLPALVTDIPGNREWIKPGFNGWLFPVDDPQAMAALTLQSLAELDSLATVSEAARATAEEKADWNSGAGMLMDAYARALDLTEPVGTDAHGTRRYGRSTK